MIRTSVTIETSQTGMKRGNLRKKYISRKMKNQSITITPGVFWSTMYHMTIEKTLEIDEYLLVWGFSLSEDRGEHSNLHRDSCTRHSTKETEHGLSTRHSHTNSL